MLCGNIVSKFSFGLLLNVVSIPWNVAKFINHARKKNMEKQGYFYQKKKRKNKDTLESDQEQDLKCKGYK